MERGVGLTPPALKSPDKEGNGYQPSLSFRFGLNVLEDIVYHSVVHYLCRWKPDFTLLIPLI